MDFYPPPQNELPDYAFGRLIYYDSVSQDACRWVVYDGRQRIRFYSRKAAVSYCAQKAAGMEDKELADLMVITEAVRRSYQKLEILVDVLPAEDKLFLGRKALELRLIADQLDGFTAQFMTHERDVK